MWQGVQRHEHCTAHPAAVCLIHSEEMLLVILLHIVGHLWLATCEYATHSSLHNSDGLKQLGVLGLCR